jgi:glycosyltransferase involved in cell wall biosynthesis
MNPTPAIPALPPVSHIIPLYNAARYVTAALESLRAELRPEDEIVIVDDGSTDDSAAIAAAWSGPVRLFRGPNAGAAAARNRGVAEARNPVIAFLDADDLAQPDRLRVLGERLLAPDRPDLVYGGQRRFLSPDALPPGAALPPEIDEPNSPLLGTMLLWRETFLRTGPFDASLRGGELIPWFSKAGLLGLRFVSIPAIVMRRRRHAGNLSADPAYREHCMRAIRQVLQQQRQAGATP